MLNYFDKTFSVKKLQSLKKADNSSLKANDEHKIEAQFDVVLPALRQESEESKTKSVIIVEVKHTLISDNIKKFLEKLKVIDLFFDTFDQHIFFGAFAFINADEAVLEEANAKGLYLIRLKPEFKEENFGTFTPAQFPYK